MHRPGIASVYGNRVVLDGTTLDEVERYHRDTLKLVVDRANEIYNELQQESHAMRIKSGKDVQNTSGMFAIWLIASGSIDPIVKDECRVSRSKIRVKQARFCVLLEPCQLTMNTLPR